MRSPGARVLINAVDIYPFAPAFDADGGLDGAGSYAGTPTYSGVPCTAQNVETKVVEQSDGRVTDANVWHLMFGSAAIGYGLGPGRAKLVWTCSGVTHTGYYDGSTDEAGRGGAYTVTAVENR